MSQLSWMRRTKFVFRGSPLWFVFAFLRPLSTFCLALSFILFPALFTFSALIFCCCCFLFRLKLKSFCVPIKKSYHFALATPTAATATLRGNSVALQQEQQQHLQHGEHMWAGEISAILDSLSQLVQTSSPSRYSFLFSAFLFCRCICDLLLLPLKFNMFPKGLISGAPCRQLPPNIKHLLCTIWRCRFWPGFALLWFALLLSHPLSLSLFPTLTLCSSLSLSLSFCMWCRLGKKK